MKTIDEEIWAYIDGSCSAEERQRIAVKIESNEDYAVAYQELLKLNELMASEDLEEPSMSFSRNVMDAVALEIAPKRLKTRVNNKIIFAIASFFVLSILAIMVYAFANSETGISAPELPGFNLNFNTGNYITPTFIKGFLFFDLMLALLYVDRLLRRRSTTQH